MSTAAAPKWTDKLDYGFALRFTLASLLSLFLAFYWHLDKPVWSIMTVAIISYPDQGMLIAKFLARLLGTLIGVLAVNLIAKVALGDPWLMCVMLTLWLTLCSFLASHHKGMVTYCFALCGYTCAILGFALSMMPTPTMLFHLTQARLSEIVLGLCSMMFISLIIPPRKYEKKQSNNSAQVHQAMLSQLRSLFSLKETQLNPIQGHQWLITLADLSHFQSMRSWVLWLNNQKVKHAFTPETLPYLYELQHLRTNVINKMRSHSEVFTAHLAQLQKVLHQLDTTQQSQPIYNIPALPSRNEVSEKEWHYLNVSHQLLGVIFLKNSEPKNAREPLFFYQYGDLPESILNSVRCLVGVSAAVLFWLSYQWNMGYIMPILMGIAFTLGSTYPKIHKLIPLGVFAIAISIPTAYFLRFNLFSQNNELIYPLAIFSLVLFASGLLKSISIVTFMLSHLFILGVIFLIDFSAPMTYNYEQFYNFTAGLSISAVFALVMFYVFSPTEEPQRDARIFKAIDCRLKRILTLENCLSQYGNSHYITSALTSLNLGTDADIERGLLRLQAAKLAQPFVASGCLSMQWVERFSQNDNAFCLEALNGFRSQTAAERNDIWRLKQLLTSLS